MGINPLYPTVDSIASSWADIIVRATPADAPMIDLSAIKSIKRSRTVELGEQRVGGRVVKRTTGSVKLELSMTLYRDGWIDLLAKLALIAPARGNQKAISLVHFGIQVQHTPIGDARIYEWRAKGVRILGDALDASEGNDADSVDVPLSVIEIVDMVGSKEVVML